MKYVKAGNDSQSHRNQERIHTENETPATIFLKIPHVDFQAGQKHDVQQTCCTRQNNTTIPKNQVKAVRPDNRTRYNQSQ